MNKSLRQNLLPTLARNSPLIFLIILITNILLNPTYNSAYLFISYISVVLLNSIEKNAIAKPIYKALNISNMPILGLGGRPPGATGCDIQLDNKPSTSFGMPSGHSQIAWAVTTYLIAKYIISKSFSNLNIWRICLLIFIIICAIYVSYSRVYIEGCHTLEQVIVGGLLGILCGYIVYKFENRVVNYLNEKLNY